MKFCLFVCFLLSECGKWSLLSRPPKRRHKSRSLENECTLHTVFFDRKHNDVDTRTRFLSARDCKNRHILVFDVRLACRRMAPCTPSFLFFSWKSRDPRCILLFVFVMGSAAFPWVWSGANNARKRAPVPLGGRVVEILGKRGARRGLCTD